jgi:hypothetical protein
VCRRVEANQNSADSAAEQAVTSDETFEGRDSESDGDDEAASEWEPESTSETDPEQASADEGAQGERSGAQKAQERQSVALDEVEMLQEAIKEASQGLGINASELETSLLNAGLMAQQEAQQAKGAGQQLPSSAAAAAEQQGGAHAGDDAGAGGRASPRVGPPSPQSEQDLEDDLFNYDEQDEDVEEHDYKRSGMFAEL